MFGSVVLDVAIGMAFVYLLLSLVASSIQEIIAAFVQMRAANLQRGLRSLFSGDAIGGVELVDALYTHGLVRGLFSDPSMDLKTEPPSEVWADRVKEAKLAFKAAQQALAQATKNPPASDPASPTETLADLELKLKAAEAEVGHAQLRADAYKWRNRFHVVGRTPINILRNIARKLLGIKPEKEIQGVSNQMLLPSYIPSRTFALALIDLLNHEKASGDGVVKSIADRLATDESKAAEALRSLALNANGKLEAFQKNVEDWYNDAMDRVSGWYKHYTQSLLLLIGIVLAVAFNVDSINVAETLWIDRDARQAMVAAADEYVKRHPDPAPIAGSSGAPDQTAGSSETAVAAAGTSDTPAPTAGSADTQGAPAADASNLSSKPGDLKAKLDEQSSAFSDAARKALLPVGWTTERQKVWCDHFGGLCTQPWTAWIRWGTVPQAWWAAWDCKEIIAGWIVTAVAISLGAAFWFDLLNKFMVVRSTVKPSEKSPQEKSKS